MAPRFTQREIDTKILTLIHRAFELAIHHLSGPDQVFAGRLHISLATTYLYGPASNRQITAALVRSHTDTFRGAATAIDMLLCAILRAPPGERPVMIANATTPPIMPAVACFLVMLDDARTQATYEHVTGLPCSNTAAAVPTPFYTTPLAPGGRYLLAPGGRYLLAGGVGADHASSHDADNSFDQHRQRLAGTQFWCRWANAARPFPYASWAATMDDGNWADAGTVAALNRVRGYWVARLGYAAASEHPGPWAIQERAFVLGMLEREEEAHDLDVVDSLNEFMAGTTVRLRNGDLVPFRPRGVFGLRRLIQEEWVAVWRMALWEEEWIAEKEEEASQVVG